MANSWVTQYEGTLNWESSPGRAPVNLFQIKHLISVKNSKGCFTVILSQILESIRLSQASTDGLSSICPPVHLRPHFKISNGPSSESVHEVDSPSSSAVHLRPSRTNNHGLSGGQSMIKKIGPFAHLKMIILIQRPNLSMR